MRARRKGLAAAEAAVCIPFVVVFALASIEACSMIYLKQSVTIAAYEGARTGNALGATSSDVDSVCQQIFADRGISGATVQTTPSEISTASSGQYFSVSCSAPCAGNSLLPLWFYTENSLINGRAEFLKKF